MVEFISRERGRVWSEGDAIPILVIEMPPRHGKSEYVSHWLPVWATMVRGEKVALVSYVLKQARLYGRRARDAVSEFGHLFGVALDDASEAADDWNLTNGGGMLATGLGGMLPGRGCQVMIVDDYCKNQRDANSQVVRDFNWDWFQSSALTRLEPGGCAIVLGTRWHPDDLIGRILNSAQDGDLAVERINLPAINAQGEALWPERWPVGRMAAMKKIMDPAAWATLYQQQPTRGGRAKWPEAYFGPSILFDLGPWEKPGVKHGDYQTVIAVDSALGVGDKADYSASVAVTLADGALWVEADIERRPLEVLIDDVIGMADRVPPLQALGVESNGFQSLVSRELDRVVKERNRMPLPTIPIENYAVPKAMRIERLGPYFAGGKVRIRHNKGGRRLIEQLKDFPLGSNDDGPDALEMAIRVWDQVLFARRQVGRTERVRA